MRRSILAWQERSMAPNKSVWRIDPAMVWTCVAPPLCLNCILIGVGVATPSRAIVVAAGLALWCFGLQGVPFERRSQRWSQYRSALGVMAAAHLLGAAVTWGLGIG